MRTIKRSTSIARNIRFTGIHHLAMATRDMETTVRFWRDLLGMRLVVGYGRSGYRQYFFHITDHDMITFFEWPGVEPIPDKEHGAPVNGPFAFDHVAFEVADGAALFALKDMIEAAGFWVSEAVDHGFIHSIYTFDPNNIPIEFTAPVPGVDVRKRPVMNDRNPLPVTYEGCEPQPGHWPEVDDPTPEDEQVVYPGEDVLPT